MDWSKCAKDDKNQITIPFNWLDVHYYEALSILFRFENALRIFVYTVLKNQFQEKWMDASFSEAGKKNVQSVKSLYKIRKNQVEKFGYLGHHVECPIMHLTSGELITIILSDSYWKKIFKEYFSGSRDSIKTKLLEIVSVRNSLAHFRPVKSEDVDYIKQNINHVLLIIEERLGELFDITTPVPTNTKMDWYTKTMNIEIESGFVSLFQSKNAEWIKISLSYNPKILSHSSYSETYISARALNLRSQAALDNYSEISKYVTCLMESPPIGQVDAEIKITTSKTLSFVFQNTILEDNQESIVNDFVELVKVIESETDLVREDNLAKGTIVESANCYAQLNEDSAYWYVDASAMKCDCKPNDPPEYWGNVGFMSANFLSSTQNYPWMPAPISSYNFIPF